MWDNLLVQTELTIKLLRQSTLNPRVSAWEYLNGPFDYDETELGPVGCRIIIHNKSNKQKSWDQHVHEGFNVGPALKHYRCFQAIDRKTKQLLITDTVEFLHEYLTKPMITPEDRMTHIIHFLTASLKDVPESLCDLQLASIEAVRAIFSKWRTVENNPTVPKETPTLSLPFKPAVPYPKPRPV